MQDCKMCEVWNRAAIENGYSYGLCEKCYNERYVTVNLPYQPKEKPVLNIVKERS